MVMEPMKDRQKVRKPPAMAATVTGLLKKPRNVLYSVIATASLSTYCPAARP